MSLHQKHKNKLADSYFETGSLYHIVPGNKGRLLDGRRTPGMIEEYDYESAMFTWRILDFEDKGKCWEIPAEQITQYQFERNSKNLTKNETMQIEERCKLFQEKLVIKTSNSDLFNTLELIDKEKKRIKNWFLKESQFVTLGNSCIDMEAKVGSKLLFNDLKSYMDMNGILGLEKKTSEQYLLNPNSGEWIKGLKIVMAEMGLLNFNEKKPRTKNIFKGIGSRENREKYIISRLAFIQTFFKLAGYDEVKLFRGVVSEGENFETPETLLSTSFNYEVGKAFSNMEEEDKVKFSYLIKFTYPIENLFMTFFETETFNERYREQEAVVLYRNKLYF